MLISCWSVKGGSGTSVVAASLAILLAEGSTSGSLLVDIAGDQASLFGLSHHEHEPGLSDWLNSGTEVPAAGLRALEITVGGGVCLLQPGRCLPAHSERWDVLASLLDADDRAVVVDCGVINETSPSGSLGCCLAGRAVQSLLVVRPCYLALRRVAVAPLRPSGVVIVAENGRALSAADVAAVVGAPILAQVSVDPAVARAVDAGILGRRLPRPLARSLRHVCTATA